MGQQELLLGRENNRQDKEMFAHNYYMPIANLIYVSRIIIRKTADRERIMRHTVNQSKDAHIK